MAVFKRGRIWWYEFWFAGRRIQESTKAKSKTRRQACRAKAPAGTGRRFNSIEDRRDERIRTIKEVAKDYLQGYLLRNRSATFAEYAIGHVIRLLGATMIVDADENIVLEYQEQRLRERAAPKFINEEVEFLLRLLAERGQNSSAHVCENRRLSN